MGGGSPPPIIFERLKLPQLKFLSSIFSVFRYVSEHVSNVTLSKKHWIIPATATSAMSATRCRFIVFWPLKSCIIMPMAVLIGKFLSTRALILGEKEFLYCLIYVCPSNVEGHEWEILTIVEINEYA